MSLNPQNYQSLAGDAALLEREGLFEQAKAYWLQAARVASAENRLWAENRARACEMREMRIAEKRTRKAA